MMFDSELVEVVCPHCGQPTAVGVDCSGRSQLFVDDCQVCCRPIQVAVVVDDEGRPHVEVSAGYD
ncbi:MAG: CPXCG motif-containing cysteine-rich protein [Planctomycetota bacterium]|jgi:hypothetical protein